MRHFPLFGSLSALLLLPTVSFAVTAEASAPLATPVLSAEASPPVESPASSDESWWQQARDVVSATWHSENYELLIPLYTWHNRHAYSAEKIAEYNENPWGLGAGKYRYDDQGNRHALYAMAFLDSHSQVEPVAGYRYEKIWRPSTNWRLGAGVTAGFTARQDYNYLPLPIILPLVSIEYGRFALQATYVPGGKGYGNVLFTWARWQF